VIRTAALLFAVFAVSACSGEMVATVMPGQVVSIDGSTFTVNDTPRGVTVQNFETGRTNPNTLQDRAERAVEQVTGCKVTAITKDGLTNTYYASTDCAA